MSQVGAGAGSGAGAGQDPAGGTGGTGNPAGAGAGTGEGGGGTGTGGHGAGSGQPPAGTGTGSGTPPETFSREYVESLRAEAAKHRTEKQEFADRLKKLEEAQLSEQEKVALRLKETETENARLKGEVRRSSILQAATKAGANVPEAIVGMVTADAEDLPAAVNAIKKQFPSLFTPPKPGGSADGGAGTGEGGAPKLTMNDILRRAAGKG